MGFTGRALFNVTRCSSGSVTKNTGKSTSLAPAFLLVDVASWFFRRLWNIRSHRRDLDPEIALRVRAVWGSKTRQLQGDCLGSCLLGWTRAI